MGQKLEGFLRVLASGLSPQAFQANVQQFQTERVGLQQEEAEVRSEDRGVRKIKIEQGFANLGHLGVAMKDAIARNDTQAIAKIGASAKEIAERFPRFEKDMKSSFATYTLADMEDEKPEKTGISMIDPAGNEFMGFQEGRQFKMRNKAGNLIPVPHGTIKAPTKQLTGKLSKSQRGKLTLGGIEGEQNLRNNVRDIDRLIETVSSPDFLGGNLGNAVQALNSARSQVTQLFGGEDYLTEDGQVNPEAFRTDSKFRKQAIQGTLAESQTLELAFILAKSLNPDGKISDADVRQAGQILGDSADPQVRKRLLDNAKKRMIDRYNSNESVVARRLKKKFTPLTYKGLTGTKIEEGSAEDTASKLLGNVGL